MFFEGPVLSHGSPVISVRRNQNLLITSLSLDLLLKICDFLSPTELLGLFLVSKNSAKTALFSICQRTDETSVYYRNLYTDQKKSVLLDAACLNQKRLLKKIIRKSMHLSYNSSIADHLHALFFVKRLSQPMLPTLHNFSIAMQIIDEKMFGKTELEYLSSLIKTAAKHERNLQIQLLNKLDEQLGATHAELGMETKMGLIFVLQIALQSFTPLVIDDDLQARLMGRIISLDNYSEFYWKALDSLIPYITDKNLHLKIFDKLSTHFMQHVDDQLYLKICLTLTTLISCVSDESIKLFFTNEFLTRRDNSGFFINATAFQTFASLKFLATNQSLEKHTIEQFVAIFQRDYIRISPDDDYLLSLVDERVIQKIGESIPIVMSFIVPASTPKVALLRTFIEEIQHDELIVTRIKLLCLKIAAFSQINLPLKEQFCYLVLELLHQNNRLIRMAALEALQYLVVDGAEDLQLEIVNALIVQLCINNKNLIFMATFDVMQKLIPVLIDPTLQKKLLKALCSTFNYNKLACSLEMQQLIERKNQLIEKLLAVMDVETVEQYLQSQAQSSNHLSIEQILINAPSKYDALKIKLLNKMIPLVGDLAKPVRLHAELIIFNLMQVLSFDDQQQTALLTAVLGGYGILAFDILLKLLPAFTSASEILQQKILNRILNGLTTEMDALLHYQAETGVNLVLGVWKLWTAWAAGLKYEKLQTQTLDSIGLLLNPPQVCVRKVFSALAPKLIHEAPRLKLLNTITADLNHNEASIRYETLKILSGLMEASFIESQQLALLALISSALIDVELNNRTLAWDILYKLACMNSSEIVNQQLVCMAFNHIVNHALQPVQLKLLITLVPHLCDDSKIEILSRLALLHQDDFTLLDLLCKLVIHTKVSLLFTIQHVPQTLQQQFFCCFVELAASLQPITIVTIPDDILPTTNVTRLGLFKCAANFSSNQSDARSILAIDNS